MPPTQNNQTLPSFRLVSSSAPFLFTKTTRPEMTATALPNIQVPATGNIWFDTRSVPDAFQGIGALILDSLSIMIRKLKLIKERLFGVRSTTASATAGV